MQQLGLGSGVLLAVPIPPEDEAQGAEVEAATRTALQVKGRDTLSMMMMLYDVL